MAIIADSATRIIIIGKVSQELISILHHGLLYGTKYVALVDPKSADTTVHELPVFSTVREAQRHTNSAICVVLSSNECAADAMLEAEDAGIPCIVCMTKAVPAHDFCQVIESIQSHKTSELIGPACEGIITPGHCKIGTIPGYIFSQGPIGVIYRSNSLLCEAVMQMNAHKIGQSTCVSIGSAQLLGSGFVACIDRFEKDPHTEAILLLGTAGGRHELQAAEYLSKKKTKPVVAYFAGSFSMSLQDVQLDRKVWESTMEFMSRTKARLIQSPSAIGESVLLSLGRHT